MSKQRLVILLPAEATGVTELTTSEEPIMTALCLVLMVDAIVRQTNRSGRDVKNLSRIREPCVMVSFRRVNPKS